MMGRAGEPDSSSHRPYTCLLLGPRSFGHADAGGQLAFGDDEYGVGFAYLSNQMGGYGDARALELARVVSRCLGDTPVKGDVLVIEDHHRRLWRHPGLAHGSAGGLIHPNASRHGEQLNQMLR